MLPLTPLLGLRMGRSVVALSRRIDDSCNTGPDPPYPIGTIAGHQCPSEDHLLVVIFTCAVHIHSVVLTPRITPECTHDAQVILEIRATAPEWFWTSQGQLLPSHRPSSMLCSELNCAGDLSEWAVSA